MYTIKKPTPLQTPTPHFFLTKLLPLITNLDHIICKRPVPLGHEVAGTIVKLGPGIVNHNLGKRIAVALTIHSIGQVDRSKAIGFAYDAGYAGLALLVTATSVIFPMARLGN